MRSTTKIACLGLLAVIWPVAASAQIMVTASVDHEEYVARQPITLWVSLRNAGNDTLRIMPPSRLGMNMEFLYYEVTEPGGATIRRKHHYMFVDGVINPDYPGEPLLPGEAVEVTLNPTLSASLPGEPARRGFTFDAPGKYVLRVAYVPHGYYRLLWRPEDGSDNFSNEVPITIHVADDTERRIFDAYWGAYASGAIFGDDELAIDVDIPRIRAVLAEHASHPLSDYLRFNLARGLLSKAIQDEEAVLILEELRGRDFRISEVHSILAVAYSFQGRRDEAMHVLFDGIRKRPALLTNDNFMRRVVFVYYGSHDKVREWEGQCMEGKRRDFLGVPIPDDVLRAGERE